MPKPHNLLKHSSLISAEWSKVEYPTAPTTAAIVSLHASTKATIGFLVILLIRLSANIMKFRLFAFFWIVNIRDKIEK